MYSSRGDDDDGDPDESRPVLYDPEFVYCHRAVHNSTLDPHLYCCSCGGKFPVISGIAITAASKCAHERSCCHLMAARRTSSSKFNDDDDDEMQDDGTGTSSLRERFYDGDEGRSCSEDRSSAGLDDDDGGDDGDSTDTSSDASDVLDGARGGT